MHKLEFFFLQSGATKTRAIEQSSNRVIDSMEPPARLQFHLEVFVGEGGQLAETLVPVGVAGGTDLGRDGAAALAGECSLDHCCVGCGLSVVLASRCIGRM